MFSRSSCACFIHSDHPVCPAHLWTGPRTDRKHFFFLIKGVPVPKHALSFFLSLVFKQCRAVTVHKALLCIRCCRSSTDDRSVQEDVRRWHARVPLYGVWASIDANHGDCACFLQKILNTQHVCLRHPWNPDLLSSCIKQCQSHCSSVFERLAPSDVFKRLAGALLSSEVHSLPE